MPFILLTAASAVPLTNFQTAARADLLRYFLMDARIVLVVFLVVVTSLTLKYFVEGRRAVNCSLMFEEWLIAVDTCSNGGSYAAKRGRYASIKYETLRTDDDLSGEDFQNRGTFIVVRSSVFSVSSAQKTHLARDAYHAY